MGKYAALRSFLERQNRDHVPMTFGEIESILRLPLPASKRYPAWWSNNPSNNPMTREWLEAGYETESVNIAGERLVFRRIRGGAAKPSGSAGAPGGSAPVPLRAGRHPLFGSLKGMLTPVLAVDLTEPADPELADHFDETFGRESRQAG